MRNNKGKGLYEIGEKHYLECGCVIVAEETGYTHYVFAGCTIDNHYHPQTRSYEYKPISMLNSEFDEVDRTALNFLKGAL